MQNGGWVPPSRNLPSATNAGWANANPHATGGVGANTVVVPSVVERNRAHIDLKVNKAGGLGFSYEFRTRKGKRT